MEVNAKLAGWAKRAGLLALAAFTGACSDVSGPTELDSDIDPQFSGGTQGPPPAVVLGLNPEQFTFQGPESVVNASNCVDTLNGTYTYTLGGIAFGTYEGRFTETGTVTVTAGIVTYLKARFTIIGKSLIDPDGPDYRIKGRKELTEGLVGECLTVGPILDPAASGFLSYVATIITPSGHKFLDRGTSQLLMASEQVATAEVTSFDEAFQSELLEGPTPCIDDVPLIGAIIDECPDLGF